MSVNKGMTTIEMKKANYTWVVKNFGFCNKEVGHKIVSPEFSTTSDDKLKWYLILYPNGVSDSYKNHVSISFAAATAGADDGPFPVEAEFSLSILNAEKKPFFEAKRRCKYLKKGDTGSFHEFALKSFLSEHSESFLKNDEIIIFCEYTVIYGKKTHLDLTYTKKSITSKKQYLSPDAFEEQFESEEFCDFTLIASCGKKLRAHKFILASQSPVFLKMLRSNMKEKEDNEVNITDIDADVLKEMLRYIYTGTIENIEKISEELSMVAEKYQLDDLKDFLENYFFEKISVNNAVEILSLCMRYNMTDLKDYVCRFVKANAKTILDNQEIEKINETEVLLAFIQLLRLE